MPSALRSAAARPADHVCDRCTASRWNRPWPSLIQVAIRPVEPNSSTRTSGRRSPLTSPTAIPSGDPLSGCRPRESTRAWKFPSPVPRSTDNPVAPSSAVATSGFPSPSKSAVTSSHASSFGVIAGALSNGSDAAPAAASNAARTAITAKASLSDARIMPAPGMPANGDHHAREEAAYPIATTAAKRLQRLVLRLLMHAIQVFCSLIPQPSQTRCGTTNHEPARPTRPPGRECRPLRESDSAQRPAPPIRIAPAMAHTGPAPPTPTTTPTTTCSTAPRPTGCRSNLTRRPRAAGPSTSPTARENRGLTRLAAQRVRAHRRNPRARRSAIARCARRRGGAVPVQARSPSWAACRADVCSTSVRRAWSAALP